MEEIENPTEKIHEELHEHALHAHEGWISWVALSAALLAAFAAITSLLAGHHANEAMIEQIKASDQWAYYQAKGIKAATLGAKQDLLIALGKAPSDADRQKSEQYKQDQENISEKATELESSSAVHLSHHVIFARGVTMFQVAIAIAAISVLTRRRRFWFVGLGFGAIGLFFLIEGMIR